MTEPQGGSDPRVFTTRAVRDGLGEDADWIINGRKYWSSNASVATFFIVVAITDPDVPVHKGASTFLVPKDTPGVIIEATHHLVGSHKHDPGHSLVATTTCGCPPRRCSAKRAAGSVSHSRGWPAGGCTTRCASIGVAQRAIDMMARRAKSRFTQGSLLADKQLIQEFVADSYVELTQFRLLVLYAAWLVDTQGEHAAREAIAACKIQTATVLKAIGLRAIQVHGGLGLTDQMPLTSVLFGGIALGLADGPTEAHKINLARMVLKGYEPEDPLWPSEFLSNRIERAREKYGHLVDRIPALPVSP